MLTAKDAKIVIKRLLPEGEIMLLCYLCDHYKILGLPSGEKFTDKQISEAFIKKISPFFLKFLDVDSSLPLTIDDELREKLEDFSWGSFVQRYMEKQKEGESGYAVVVLVVSYYILTDPEMRELFENWRISTKWLEKMKIINREKEELDEYMLLSYDDFQRVRKLCPWILAGWEITLPVWLPAVICWWIGRLSYKAIQSAVSMRSGAGECSSGGGEDIQDWELVNEDDCC